MNRRRFICSFLGTTSLIPLSGVYPLLAGKAYADAVPTLPSPTADQLAWQDLEIGMFIHFAPNTWQDKELDDLSTPLSQINPELLDTDQWVASAMDLGAKYIVFVAKHVGGFCMWQTDTTDYGIRKTSWRGGHGDVLADLAGSCRKVGMKFGVYISPRDDKFGAGGGGRCKTPEKQNAYNIIYRQQLTEILSRYGEMFEVWFDGSNVVHISDILKKYAPHAMIYESGPNATIRGVGNEEGFAVYPAWNTVTTADAKTGGETALHGDPNGSVWLPNEAHVSILRPDWFWSTTNENYLLSLDTLLDIYYRTNGRGAQLIVNVPPDNKGLIPDSYRARMREFRSEIQRRFGHSVAETSGSGDSISLPLPNNTRIDHVIMQENCASGERVRGYRVEAQSKEEWKVLGTGSAIGHKRIQPVEPTMAGAIRLVITESAGRPEIRRLAVFNTNSLPPSTWNADTKVPA
ncbi:alpha-L-fucosidase [Acidobacterium sp. S8]|uniref:alpha-L-fucosidase n=1 Tax=Acidobacterium sp. S8 TaxID=1641854 RepID=UPI00131D6BB3|nr:alpha-L-fucosidase [Acidobacterium sp. S8]